MFIQYAYKIFKIGSSSMSFQVCIELYVAFPAHCAFASIDHVFLRNNIYRLIMFNMSRATYDPFLRQHQLSN